MPILERKIAYKMTTLCSHITYPEFVLPLHKHAEYELMIFTHGSGKQFVGDGVAPYAQGDVALIGSYVSHLHLCKSRMKCGGNVGKDKLGNGVDADPKSGLDDRLFSSGEAIQFSPNLFPSSLLNLPDYAHISELLSKSQYGMRFYDECLYDELMAMMQTFDSSTHTARLIVLLQILDRLYHCRKTQLLSPTAYNNANRQPELEEPIGRNPHRICLQAACQFRFDHQRSGFQFRLQYADSLLRAVSENHPSYAC